VDKNPVLGLTHKRKFAWRRDDRCRSIRIAQAKNAVFGLKAGGFALRFDVPDVFKTGAALGQARFHALELHHALFIRTEVADFVLRAGVDAPVFSHGKGAQNRLVGNARPPPFVAVKLQQAIVVGHVEQPVFPLADVPALGAAPVVAFLVIEGEGDALRADGGRLPEEAEQEKE